MSYRVISAYRSLVLSAFLTTCAFLFLNGAVIIAAMKANLAVEQLLTRNMNIDDLASSLFVSFSYWNQRADLEAYLLSYSAFAGLVGVACLVAWRLRRHRLAPLGLAMIFAIVLGGDVIERTAIWFRISDPSAGPGTITKSLDTEVKAFIPFFSIGQARAAETGEGKEEGEHEEETTGGAFELFVDFIDSDWAIFALSGLLLSFGALVNVSFWGTILGLLAVTLVRRSERSIGA